MSAVIQILLEAKGRITPSVMIHTLKQSGEEIHNINKEIFSEELATDDYTDRMAISWAICALESIKRHGWSIEKDHMIDTLTYVGRKRCESYCLTPHERSIILEIYGPFSLWNRCEHTYHPGLVVGSQAANKELCIADYNGVLATKRVLEYVIH